jgi:uncharacterized membrane protein YeaQ/YmgE (transglycosylase-associated protein family)
MENGTKLKKEGVVVRMARYPVGAFIGALSTAVLCGYLGSSQGTVAIAVMGVLGAIVGALLGAMLAASIKGEL